MSKAKVFVALSASACGFVGWWWRPIADPMEGDQKGPVRGEWMSKNLLSDFADEPKPLLYEIARHITVFVTVTAARSFLVYGGDFKIKNDDKYANFIQQVYARPKGKPLLTVSNHRSLADDTTVFSSILPYWMNIQPKYLRYSLCAQEYCFNPKFPSFVNAYIGLGKTFPIWRGGGINQKLLLDYARLVAAGEWCHIYPEAGIFVQKTIGGRNNGTEKEIGKLKWGVGKLIAHSPEVPTVIPIFFSGTEGMINTDPVTRKTLSYIPQGGHKVQIRFGSEVTFTDLIEAHEAKYGKLWKYAANIKNDVIRNDTPAHGAVAVAVSAGDGVPVLSAADATTIAADRKSDGVADFHAHWDSRPEDLILYNKITRRIEDALSRLNDENNAETEEVETDKVEVTAQK